MDLYGDFNLQRDDHDGSQNQSHPPRWGGVDNPPPPAGESAQTPQEAGGATFNVPQYVQKLQRDLRSLGFMIIPEPNGKFDRYTEWAVKEFQCYARMRTVARLNAQRLQQYSPQTGQSAVDVSALGARQGANPPESYYVGTLDSVSNDALYTGPISGIVNARTRTAIDHWLSNNFRCPVVIEAWQINRHGQRTSIFRHGTNVWRYNEITSGGPRVFYRDFSGYYSYPNGCNPNEYQVLGAYYHYSTYGGPASIVPKHTWSQAEMMPELLVGPTTTLASLQADQNGATTSTYRVVRAAAEQECMGAFDSINAYDDALISLGPCHWTMGLMPQHGYHNGELPGFLAYVLSKDRDSYLLAFGNFGLYPSEAWTRSSDWTATNRGTLWNRHQRTFNGWIKTHNDNTDPAQAPNNIQNLTDVNRAADEANYFKTWHWFFRMIMAGRTVAQVQQAMWDMVRYRLRDVLDVPVRAGSGPSAIVSTLGHIFTSEKAVAILLRWHIYRPAHVTGQRVSSSIQSAINASPTLAWTLPPAQWTDAHESALTSRLLADATAVNPTQALLAAWPSYTGRADRHYALGDELGSLRETRNSFSLDSTGL
ncbi:peptidoglycan-binding domain-containing protein [Paraburkholderia sp. J76]|uniref:peptidoglycan-binding domain-containing protein n=1 Tax=Paraburkholderia sp. J76 TaxID=2805439 RepID=UPI002ABDE51D|nr:peptidoglycan-binding domain-containing protein [Paraburkholderia sp. J76]